MAGGGATIPARSALALLWGEAPAEGHASFSGPSGARGVRSGGWVLNVDAQGGERLFQVTGDPSEVVDLAAELPGRVAELRDLLGR